MYTRLLLYILFTLSGFAALVLELVWSRKLSLTFGTTMPAVSSVAAVFMFGLATGNLWFGQLADRVRTPLVLYAILETVIAVTGFSFPFFLDQVTELYVNFSQFFPEGSLLIGVFRALFSALLLLPATICMGGTFPVLCRQLASTRTELAAGKLYAVNTLGAALGVGFAGFWLLPGFGLEWSSYLAIGICVLIAAGSFALSRTGVSSDERSIPSQLTSSAPSLQRTILFGVTVSGTCALAFEILWTRLFMQFMGSTIYAFASILFCFLLGLAGGGALASLYLRRGMNPRPAFLVSLGGAPIVVLLTLPGYDNLAYLFQRGHELAQGNWIILSFACLVLAGLTMLLPTVLFGALLPLSIACHSPTQMHTGRVVGQIITWNTTGAIIGSLLSGFFLLPLFGLERSFKLISVILLVSALFIMTRLVAASRRNLMAASIAILILIFSLSFPNWDQRLMNAGVYYYAYRIEDSGGLDSFIRQSRLLNVVEGRDATVAVKESMDGRERFLSINGKTDAGNGHRDMPTQLLLAHLPLLLHPQADSVLVIGLGSGITFGTAANYPVQRLNCVEIAQEVKVGASYFSGENQDILAKAPESLIIADARNHLMTNGDIYDVIISEPSNPWQSGNANLFTIDFYRLAKARLNPSGIFCQWLPLYDLPPDKARIVYRTFTEAFPNILVFRAESDLILLGSQSPLAFDYPKLQQRIAEQFLNGNLSKIGIDSPGDIIGRYFMTTGTVLQKLAEDAPLNTDANPYLEFSYRNIFQPKLFEQNLSAINSYMGRQRLPLINSTTDLDKKRAMLVDLGQGFASAGRDNVAGYFFELAENL